MNWFETAFSKLTSNKVVRTAAGYCGIAWGTLQAVSFFQATLGLPESTDKLAIIFLIIGFLPVVLTTWAVQPDSPLRRRQRYLDPYAYDSIIADPTFHSFVRDLYADQPLLSFGHHEYACMVITAPPTQNEHPDSIIEGPPKVVRQSLTPSVAYPEYRKALCALDSQSTYDGAKFTLNRVVSTNPLRIECTQGSYFDALETCDGLKFELQKAWSKDRQALIRRGLNALPLRSSLHSHVSNPITDGDGRTAALAVSTLICFRDTSRRGDFNFTCRLLKRSHERLAVDRALWHVVPAGMLEPSSSGHRGACSVQENVYREYVEELYGEEEPQDNEDPYWYKNTDGFRTLAELLKTGGAQLFLTGLAVNLLNLRPEICTLLLVRSPDWFEHEVQGGTKHGGKITRNWEHEKRTALDIPLGDESVIAKEFPELAPTTMVIPGAAAFALGFRLARQLTAHPQAV